MIKPQVGFTLLELMVVLTIIAILAVIGLPTYQDYTVRARVTEGLELAQDAKKSVAENAAKGVALNMNTPGNGRPAIAATQHVTAGGVTVDAANGEIRIAYLPNAGNGTLYLSPREGGPAGGPLVPTQIPNNPITWNCNASSSTKLGTKGTLQDKYAPSECR